MLGRAAAAALIVLTLVAPSIRAPTFTDVPHTRWIVHVDYGLDIDGHYDAMNETRLRSQSTQQTLTVRANWEATFKLDPPDRPDDPWPYSEETGSHQARLRLFQLDDDTMYNSSHDIISRQTSTIDCDQTVPIKQEIPIAGRFTIHDQEMFGDLTPVATVGGLEPCMMKGTSFDVHAGTRTSESKLGPIGIPFAHAGLPAGKLTQDGSRNAWGRPGEKPLINVGGILFHAPLNKTTTFDTGDGASYPPGEPGTAEQQYCIQIRNAAYAPDKKGTCSWRGEMDVTIRPDPCEGIQEEYAARVGVVKSLGPVPPKGPDRGYRLAAFGQTAGYFVNLVFAVVRYAELWGCDLTQDPYIPKLVGDLRAAWEEYWASSNPDPRYGDDWNLVKRASEALGLGSSDAGPPPAAPPQGGSVSVGVESPAALEVFARGGGHIAWDDATNASNSTIAGASYQGRPGGHQTITLPAGDYRVVVHELVNSSMVLRTTWNASGAAGGDEDALATATPGRTTSYYVSLARDGAGNWSAMTSPPLRQTTASFAPGYARPLASAPPPDVSDPPHASPPSDAAGESDETPGVGDLVSKATPALGPTAIAAALLLAFALRRR